MDQKYVVKYYTQIAQNFFKTKREFTVWMRLNGLSARQVIADCPTTFTLKSLINSSKKLQYCKMCSKPLSTPSPLCWLCQASTKKHQGVSLKLLYSKLSQEYPSEFATLEEFKDYVITNNIKPTVTEYAP